MDTYEKKYKESLALMVDCIPDEDGYVHVRPQDIFPELKGSGNEKIRKTLIDFFQDWRKNRSHCWGISVPEILAWLEKQGTSYTKKDVDDAYVEGMAFAKDELERQGEQKPVDKVGPKFKVGDWCIDNEDGTIFQIVKVLDNTYTYKTNEGKEYSCSHYSLENDAHLWTVQDARLGDVLACNEEILLFKSYSVQGRISLYCWYNGQTNNFHSKEVVDTLMTTRNKIYPATKKQRDLFFQKMKEAGYEWDAEKKELKKVEKKSQRMISAEAKEAMYDKPTDEDMKEAYEKGRADAIAEMQKEWSEEDEVKINRIVACLENLNVADNDILLKDVDWLKSLKERYFWKPKAWEIQILESVIEKGENPKNYSVTLHSILEQLKKLKGH